MFASLNRFISRLDSEPADNSGLGRGAAGFQVLRNKNPDIHLQPWFDIVVGINGRQIVGYSLLELLVVNNSQDNSDPNLFATEVRNCAGSSVTFTVWSAKVCSAFNADTPYNETQTDVVRDKLCATSICPYRLPPQHSALLFNGPQFHQPTMSGTYLK